MKTSIQFIRGNDWKTLAKSLVVDSCFYFWNMGKRCSTIVIYGKEVSEFMILI